MSNPRRPVIGVLGADLFDELPRRMWSGINSAARENRVDLIYLSAGVQRYLLNWQDAFLHQLIASPRFDGLIIIPSALMIGQAPEAFFEFLNNVRQRIPVVSLDDVIPGFPSVLKDNSAGREMMIRHLVRDHGRRKILLIPSPSGNKLEKPDPLVWKAALSALGIDQDERLITEPLPSWSYNDARSHFRKYLRDTALEPGIDFDAVCASHDDSASAVIDVLLEDGVNVPRDVSVTGYDNLDYSRNAKVPITTVESPFALTGVLALETVLKMLRKESVPEVNLAGPKVVYRQSCGCLQGLPVWANQNGKKFSSEVDQLAIPPIEELVQIPDWFSGEDKTSDQINQLLSIFLETGADSVLSEISGLIRGVNIQKGQRILAHLQDAITAGFHAFESSKRRPDEEAYTRLVQLQNITSQLDRSFLHLAAAQEENRQRYLRGFNDAVFGSLDLQVMLRSMAQAVSALGITRLVLALFDPDENEHGSVRVTFLWDKAKGISDNHPQKRFDPIILLPDSLWSSLEEKYLFVVELSYLQRSYGLLILELAWAEGLESVRWIDNIRTSLTMAIQNAKTHQQLIESRAQAETGRQAAEEADRLKSSFLTMVSHDLRTPLNVISGLSENLLSNIQGLDLKEEKQMVSDIEFIQSSARHLDSLLKDVLDLASSHGGQLVLEAENLDVRSEIDPVLQLGKRMATEKGLTWEAALPLSIPPIFFDRVRLRQILINLISNAVKFTRHGFVRVEVEITGPMVVFHVKDSGLGVPPEDQEAIFNEFRRSKRAITRGIGGMGMGLAICRHLVELGRGRIYVVSEGSEGSGSDFIFELPASRQAVHAPTPYATPGEFVLLFTRRDDPANRNLIQHLVSMNFRVQPVYPGNNAAWLDQISLNPPGALLINSDVPSESVWSLLHLVDSHPLMAEIPVVFYQFSGYEGHVFEFSTSDKNLSRSTLLSIIQTRGLLTAKGSRRTIFVIDDDQKVLDLYMRLLMEVLPASLIRLADDGKKALELLANEVPDLVFLDLNLPKVSGLDVLEHMRGDKRLMNVPVVVMTAQSLVNAPDSLIEDRLSAIISKGVQSQEEVVNQITRLLLNNPHLGSERRRVARRCLGYIHEKFGDQITRKQLADFAGVSQEYLSTCFSKEMGMPLVAYIERYRIQQAQRLLAASDLSVTEIAQRCGFNDSNYFGRVFRKETGMSPLTYRRTN